MHRSSHQIVAYEFFVQFQFIITTKHMVELANETQIYVKTIATKSIPLSTAINIRLNMFYPHFIFFSSIWFFLFHVSLVVFGLPSDICVHIFFSPFF